jgi:hypothetical protein
LMRVICHSVDAAPVADCETARGIADVNLNHDRASTEASTN